MKTHLTECRLFSVTCFAVTLLFAGVSTHAAEVPAGEVGRFQLVAATSATADGVMVFRIDTATGKTWMFDTMNSDVADDEYLKKHGLDQHVKTTQVKELLNKGMIVVVPAHWKEVPEKPSGIQMKPMPRQK